MNTDQDIKLKSFAMNHSHTITKEQDFDSDESSESSRQQAFSVTRPSFLEQLKVQELENQNDEPLPMMKNVGSLAQDIKMGWRPKASITGAPIPLYYEFEQLYYLD